MNDKEKGSSSPPIQLDAIQQKCFNHKLAYRMVNSKYPPIDLFNDVASSEEFDAIFAVQSLTNPRLQNEVGQLNLVPSHQRPFGIQGASYAIAPFVHINAQGSRFGNGKFGIFYAAKSVETCISETRYHQQKYFQDVKNLKFDTLSMRLLRLSFSAKLLNIFDQKKHFCEYYHLENYDQSQQFGNQVKSNEADGIYYASVRNQGEPCYALFSPHLIHEVVQTQHYQYQWDGEKISSILSLSMQSALIKMPEPT